MSWLSLFFALLPTFFLVLALLHGRYPGERVLARLRERRARRPRPACSKRPRWAPRARRRSGELLATALGSRGPPFSSAFA